MIHLGILEMNARITAPFFVFLTICVSRVSGLIVPSPENLKVDIWDGEATAVWISPKNAPLDFRYNVEMAIYSKPWEKVVNCTGITHTYCDLSGLIHDYTVGYKVQVQLVAGQSSSIWIKTKILLNKSNLRPPTFTLYPTSSSLTVHVHKKPILSILFPYGVIYTINLEQRGEDEKNKSELKVDDQTSATFGSLRRKAEYCVSVRVEDKSSKAISRVSPKQCVVLPEQEWYIIKWTSLSIVAMLVCASITAASFLCYLRRPAKTPAVLKLPVSNWLPLSVGEGTMEVVTDKAWFLSSYRPEGKNPVEFPVTSETPKETEVEERRTSLDSGVSMGTSTVETGQGNSPGRHDDSGCGSLSGSDSSTSNQSEWRSRDGNAGMGMDSRVDVDCQLHLSSMNLEVQDSTSPKATVIFGNYRSQSPSAATIDVRDKVFESTLCHPILAEVVSGYRAPLQVCLCSGAGQCTWCHKQGLSGRGVIGQYRATCTDNGLHSSKQDSVDSCNEMTFVSYPQKTHMDSFAVEDISAFISQESLPMLTALASQDINMNFSLSLCDVQMAAD
ncbi:hypothetical protein fugu_011208 [Takifugu bimaculatus]|uniref:Fibronectin type-III domain-containing protein n=1 Tax=Takifugu bimaculatus TaxID=433685 RepID=A0A4Z2CCD2_9TELE|nr:hypothetical protein fugu_011208 [Takifugu bimaculatus]